MAQELIYADTKPGNTFPPYVNVYAPEGKDTVTLTVRGAAKIVSHENGAYFEQGEVGEIELSAAEAMELAEAILARFETLVFERGSDWLRADAQAHISRGLSDGRDRRPPAEFADVERALHYPKTVATDIFYDMEVTKATLDSNHQGNSNGHYIGLDRDGADHGDECDCPVHGHARVG